MDKFSQNLKRIRDKKGITAKEKMEWFMMFRTTRN